MRWINKSLNRKFVLGTAAGLLVSLLVFVILFIAHYKSVLKGERADAVSEVNYLLQTSLENAMMKRDLEGLRTIVSRLSEQQKIKEVMIATPSGVVRFAGDQSKIGTQLSLEFVKPVIPVTRFISDSGGKEMLRSINPVRNKPQCKECHGDIEKNPINGVLLVDYDATSIRRQARLTIFLLMGSGALIVLINIAGGWWFIRRFILKPVDQLAAANRSMSEGNLDTRVLMSGDDELAKFGETFNRMAESLQQMMREVEEGKVYLKSLINAIPDGVRVLDEHYKIQLTNSAYRNQLLLDDDVVGQPCYQSSHQRTTPCPASYTMCPVREIDDHDEPVKFIHRHLRLDGSDIFVEVYAAPVRVVRGGEEKKLVVESIRDLSQTIKFSHEQKLADLGRLAAGVAHEIYNPLTSIRFALHAALMNSRSNDGDEEEMEFYLQLVDREIDTCIEVTERLLKLSASPSSQSELVSVNDTLTETLSLLKWDAEEFGITIVTDLKQNDLRVIATDSEIRMLTLNLTQNAFHAMPDGGKLNITAERKDNKVVIRFSDNGAGIPIDNMERIFEPFFSRRASETAGTGLGLSICKTIVDHYRGLIEVESVEGEGTTFTVALPAAEVPKGDDV
ncbi:MAG: ATP-binding protein [Candidatus Sedimenticola sp. (ex Thyasira tokunagai)]